MLNFLCQIAKNDESFVCDEYVSFARHVVPNSLGAERDSFWCGSQAIGRALSGFAVAPGQIETDHGALQADFANKYIGGSVLAGVLGQEEIRFLLCPECIAGILFTEKMLPNEAVVIVGALQYSSYRGYWEEFEFAGPGPQGLRERQLDQNGCRDVHIVAFDALNWGRGRTRPGGQYGGACVRRELLKVYAACLGGRASQGQPAGATRPSLVEERQVLATGNWGCGAFRGDPQLKALVQWLAASMAGRSIRYYSYNDERVARLTDVVEHIRREKLDCAGLYKLVVDCRPPPPSVFDTVLAWSSSRFPDDGAESA